MKTNEVIINTPFIKLDSLLKFAGISPDGASAKQIILNRKVMVNGEICTMRGRKIYTGDRIIVDRTEISVVSE